MEHEYHPFEASSNYRIFQFTSQGQRGTVAMQISYQLLPLEYLPTFYPVYNLALLAYDSTIAEFSDTYEVNNGDMPLILATVAQSLLSFSEHHPHASVFFTGSNQQRIRVYALLLRRYILELVPYFDVKGLKEGTLESFNSKHGYVAFVLTPRK